MSSLRFFFFDRWTWCIRRVWSSSCTCSTARSARRCVRPTSASGSVPFWRRWTAKSGRPRSAASTNSTSSSSRSSWPSRSRHWIRFFFGRSMFGISLFEKLFLAVQRVGWTDRPQRRSADPRRVHEVHQGRRFARYERRAAETVPVDRRSDLAQFGRTELVALFQRHPAAGARRFTKPPLTDYVWKNPSSRFFLRIA